MRPDLDVLPEVLDCLVVIFVSGPLASEYRDATRPVQRIDKHLSLVFHKVNIMLPYPFALFSVVDVKSSNGRRDGEENKPVSGW
jgi:hypothetical protein